MFPYINAGDLVCTVESDYARCQEYRDNDILILMYLVPATQLTFYN